MRAVSTTAVWTPILHGAMAGRAREAVEAIARDLAGTYSDAVTDPGLPGGPAGFAVFLAHLFLEGGDPYHEEAAFRSVERAMKQVARQPLMPALHGGFSGVAWAVEYLKGRLLDEDSEDPNEDIDRTLTRVLMEGGGNIPPHNAYDLLSGLIGIGVYALERLPRPAAKEILSLVLSHLEDRSVESPEGIAWPTKPPAPPSGVGEGHPDDLYDIGVAHGVPGAIGFLAEMFAAGLYRDRVKALLDGAVRWLLARRLPDGFESTFPTSFGPGIAPRASRLAWCHGDAGIATVLIGAALHTGDDRLLAQGLDVARSAARRPPETSAVADSGLCHGAAGLTHLFNRMYQSTGDGALEEEAVGWAERTMEMRRGDRGVGGFANYTLGPDGEVRLRDEPAFLHGAAGVGLALLAAISPIPPDWDRVLLASTPPRVDRRAQTASGRVAP